MFLLRIISSILFGRTNWDFLFLNSIIYSMLKKVRAYFKTQTKFEILFFILFFLINLSFKSRGPIRYAVLSIASLVFFLKNKNKRFGQYIVFIHVAVYVLLGLLLGLFQNNIFEQSIKQTLIYLSMCFIAINLFHFHGEKNTVKLLDMQFYGICLAYFVLYFIFNHDGTFYWESHIFAYILGLYALLYFCQKRYPHMIVSILFMLMDHKRISNLAFIAVLLLLIIYKLFKTDKNRSVFLKILQFAFVFSALAWIYLMSIDFLSETLKLTDRFTSLRMTLWGSAKPYYSFSISYIGKGIGWVKNWMSHVDIFQLENLHNDFLAAYIELGFAGYVLWLLSFVFIFSSLKKHTDAKKLHIGFLFFIYLFLNMLTDNTYIYISFMMPFYLIIFSLFFGEDSDSYTTYLF